MSGASMTQNFSNLMDYIQTQEVQFQKKATSIDVTVQDVSNAQTTLDVTIVYSKESINAAPLSFFDARNILNATFSDTIQHDVAVMSGSCQIWVPDVTILNVSNNIPDQNISYLRRCLSASVCTREVLGPQFNYSYGIYDTSGDFEILRPLSLAIARNYNYSPLIEGNPVVTAVELDIANINTNTVDTDGEPLYKKFIGINKIVVATYRYCYQ